MVEFAPGGSYTEVRGIGLSNDGSVIVGVGYSSGNGEAFRWTQAGFVGLGDLSGGSFGSAAAAVSADGSTIVGSGTIAAPGERGFIWDAAHGMRDLQDVLVNDFGLARA